MQAELVLSTEARLHVAIMIARMGSLAAAIDQDDDNSTSSRR